MIPIIDYNRKNGMKVASGNGVQNRKTKSIPSEIFKIIMEDFI